jgi:hypothetical protein
MIRPRRSSLLTNFTDCSGFITLNLSFLVFTFGSMLVAIQVASGQLTPRIIATTLLRDNVIRNTVGVFVLTMLFAIGADVRIGSAPVRLVIWIAMEIASALEQTVRGQKLHKVIAVARALHCPSPRTISPEYVARTRCSFPLDTVLDLERRRNLSSDADDWLGEEIYARNR